MTTFLPVRHTEARVTEPKTCFVICPIGDAGSDIRKQSDRLLHNIIKPALGTQYNIIRSDQIADAGRITTQIMRALGSADMVVADLSNLNPNVMYELGIRQALHKYVIHMALQGTRLPFDLGDFRTIFYGFEIEQVNAAMSELRGQLDSYDKGTAIAWNPADSAGPAAVQGDKSVQDAITQFRDIVSDMNASVNKLSDKISTWDQNSRDTKKMEAAGVMGAALLPAALSNPEAFQKIMDVITSLPPSVSPAETAHQGKNDKKRLSHKRRA